MSAEEKFGALDALIALLCLILLLIPLGYFLQRGPPVEALMISSVAVYPAAALLACALRRRSLRKLMSPGRFSTTQLLFALLGTAGITLILLSLIEPLMSYFPDSVEELEEMDRQLKSIPPGLALLLIAVLAPVGEEIFFRAALLRGFRSSLGTVAAVLLSSTIFAFFHGIAPRMIVTFLVGMWLGRLYLAGGGLALPVVAHAFNNGLVLALMFGGVERISAGWAWIGIAACLVATVALRFSRQGSPPPGTS